ncbi:uncharacterized protein [Drosophila kikkawai]|uniref:Uncharacterized protein isoform X2 n=1 Tax=Drosophila kikkawai TaxID=30033 RepID=A0ABM4GNW9_DROKI
MKAYPSLFAHVYIRCIAERTFPRAWKQQRLFLIPKPGKMNDDPFSYRLFAFERIICKKLEREIDAIREVTLMAPNAFKGERWQGGTKQYCLVCTLAVNNAFNSANWSLVLQALQREVYPRALFLGQYCGTSC